MVVLKVAARFGKLDSHSLVYCYLYSGWCEIPCLVGCDLNGTTLSDRWLWVNLAGTDLSAVLQQCGGFLDTEPPWSLMFHNADLAWPTSLCTVVHTAVGFHRSKVFANVGPSILSKCIEFDQEHEHKQSQMMVEAFNDSNDFLNGPINFLHEDKAIRLGF